MEVLEETRSIRETVRRLGYPGETALRQWRRQWLAREPGSRMPQSWAKCFGTTEKRVAVAHWLEHGRCMETTVRELGYPCRQSLAEWIAELVPDARFQKKHSAGQRRAAAMRVLAGESREGIAKEHGALVATVANWVRELNQQRQEAIVTAIGEDAHRQDAVASGMDAGMREGGGAPPGVRERELAERVRMLEERQKGLQRRIAALEEENGELRIDVAVAEETAALLGKELGTDPDNLDNADKAAIVDAARERCGATVGQLAARVAARVVICLCSINIERCDRWI